MQHINGARTALYSLLVSGIELQKMIVGPEHQAAAEAAKPVVGWITAEATRLHC